MALLAEPYEQAYNLLATTQSPEVAVLANAVLDIIIQLRKEHTPDG